jgi:HPr kinase/phosphorylase
MTLVLHASAVAWAGAGQPRGVLILGASGSGKSALALQLMAFGCVLVGDDLVTIEARDGVLLARAAKPLQAIEARGVGILAASLLDLTPVTLAVDLDSTETERLPPQRHATWLGVNVPLVHNSAFPHFPAAILHYLKHGRVA